MTGIKYTEMMGENVLPRLKYCGKEVKVLQLAKIINPQFAELDDYSIPSIEKVCRDYVAEKGIKNGQALWPIRTAVSGKQMTPAGAYEIMAVLGKEESLKRIKFGIKMLREDVNAA